MQWTSHQNIHDFQITLHLAVRRVSETQLDAPVGQLSELLDVLVQGLVGEEVVPLAPLEHDPDIPVRFRLTRGNLTND